MSWKTFKFFEFGEAKDPETQEPFSKLKDLPITCCSCGRGMMVFGDAEGFIHILSSLTNMYSFQAFVSRVQHIYQLKTRSIVVTVGDDEDFTPLIRVFNIDKRDKHGTPTCCRTMRAAVFSGGVETNNSAVTCICAHENSNLIAIGFKNGTVVVLKGEITRDKQSRQKIVHEAPSKNKDKEMETVYVTGLAFRQVGHTPVLMMSTNDAVYSCYLGDRYLKTQVGEIGCELNCSTLSDHTEDFKFVVGRTDAVHFFTTEGPAQCKVFEGEKSLVRWYRGYLIIVYEPSKGGGRAFSGARTLSIYDIQNQFVAYQGRFEDFITDILCEWGSLFVLFKSGRLITLDELDTKTKLETLFKKNLYHTAISLAKSQSYSDGLVEIFTQYGDHLYSKGDFDGAIAQFKLTIGTLEPSYVIRKFLDAQRIHNLTDYLKELHDKETATADHTTLLLNCYTKLKNVEQLNMFVKENKFSFDVEAAIKVCRQSLYYEQALAMAKRNKEHDWYLLIDVGDLKHHSDALDYIRSLEFKAAETYMIKYGRIIFEVLPDETTHTLIALCTDWTVGKKVSQAPAPGTISGPPEEILRSAPGKFIPVFVGNKSYMPLLTFLVKMTELRDCWDKDVCNTLLELYLTENIKMTKQDREARALELMKNPKAQYDVDHALMLARTCDFRDGILYLYEKAELYQQILAYHMEHDDIKQVMETCKRFSSREPSLWVQALTYFASKEFCTDKISEVLEFIDKHQLLQPLMVVQLLAQYKYATLGDIEPYLRKHLEAQNDAINKDEKHIKDYRESTVQLREQIAEIQGKAKVFQVMKCSGCQRSLNLPAVHFLCHHSFHQGTCLDDESESQCPVCARDNRKFLDIIQKHDKATDLDETFHAQLSRANDGFSVVADYFGRGVFSKVKEQDRGH